MAELLIRPSGGDEAMLERLLAAGQDMPNRIVVDAHTAATRTGFASIAGAAGLPFMIDPQTYYFQDIQHPGDPWANLPFAEPRAFTSSELRNRATMADLVQEVVDFQLMQNATRIIPPYFHIENVANGWPEVQALAWRLTRDYLDSKGIALPVTAVLAVGWRCTHPTLGVSQLSVVWRALTALAPDEVALAASKVHAGTTASDRLIDLLVLVERLSSDRPVLAWQQGLLGEACVAAGAIGYETGVGWREKCELQTKMTDHRAAPDAASHPAARPVYIEALGRSVPKRTLEQLSAIRPLWRQTLCLDPTCCRPGGSNYLDDSRDHSIRARRRSLDAVQAISQPHWRWNYLATKAEDGLELARRINARRARGLEIFQIDTIPLQAIAAVANSRRSRRRATRTA